MATLVARITLLAQAVRDKLNAIAPRLVPSGGGAGQALVKSSSADYATAWGARTLIFNGTTDAAGLATITYGVTFTNKPFVSGEVDQLSTSSDIRATTVEILSRTTTGCIIKTHRSKTTGVLIGGSVSGLEVLPSVPYCVVVTGT